MKFKTLAVALATITLAPLSANAGVTVTPLLLGYQYTDASSTNEAQREVLKTGKDLYVNKDGKRLNGNNGVNPDTGEKVNSPKNGGVSKESGLYTGAALGIELTPSTQFQVEYGVSNTNGEASERSAIAGVNRFDVEQQSLTGNFLVGADTESNFRPYLLVGAGQSKIEVKNQEQYTADANNEDYVTKGEAVEANTVVDSSKDVIGNLGLGAMYRVNDVVSLRGEGRAVHNFDNNWWEGMALAGLEVVLGGHLAKPVAAPVPVAPKPVEEPEVVIVEDKPVDSDNDGVYDNQDACPGTPSSLVVDARGCPQTVDVPKNWKMELRVFFDNDKSVIKDQYKPEIAKVATVMQENPASSALIEGHASKTGPSARYNQRLSEARAVAVKSVLTNEFGVEADRLTTQGFGYDRPIAPNDTAEGRALNRRVYAVINGQKTVTVEKTKDMN